MMRYRYAAVLSALTLFGSLALAAPSEERAQLAPASIAPATRIVSLAPHLTELTYSAGAGHRLLATVEFSDHPEQARRLPRIGDAFRVDYERLVALRPDLVLVWSSGTAAQTVARVRDLGLRVVGLETYRLQDVAAAVEAIGELAGTQAVAQAASQQFLRDIEALRHQYRQRTPVTVFVQVNERPLYTVNGRHIVTEMLELCGGRNVFDSLSDLAPTIGVEAVIAANPQVILATSADSPVAGRNWNKYRHIAAVRAGNVYDLPADYIARSTLRLAEGARLICRTLDTARGKLAATGQSRH